MTDTKQSPVLLSEQSVFLETFCKKLLAGNFDNLCDFFHFPTVVINQSTEHVFTNEQELADWLALYCRQFDSKAIDTFTFSLQKTLILSKKVLFLQAELKDLVLLETNEKLQVSFTLAKDEHNSSLKIVVVVLDNA